LPDLGFDYPELRDVKRRLHRALACTLPCPLSAVRRVYARALGEALGAGGGIGGGYAWGPRGLLAPYYTSSDGAAASSSCPAAAERELAGFVRAALAALLLDGGSDEAANPTAPLPNSALEQQLAPCPERDPTLPALPKGTRLLLAANLRDAGRSAPSAAVQALRLALALPPGALAVGMHEGRSSDRTPFALNVLRLMLLPLRVPQNVTTGGKSDPKDADALPRIKRMALLRDAALAPWLGSRAVVAASSREEDDKAIALALRVLPLGSSGAEEEEDGRPSAALPLPPLARPHAVAFANDAFFCAEDVLRLAAHRAPIACGFDFYSAPWQVAAAEQAEERRRQRGGEDGGGEEQRRRGPRQPDDDDDDERAGELEDPAVRRDYEEDYDSEELRERRGEAVRKEGGAETAASPSHPQPSSRSAARHYDKWVSRDRLGARLSNRPPYVRDAASAAELSRGLPVAAYCCWSGLAVLDAQPLAPTVVAQAGGGGGGNNNGVVFRADGHPHDCPASSECSLLCDDYRRAIGGASGEEGGDGGAATTTGHYHAVLDPAVRLAYDPAQSRALFAGSGTASPIPGFDVAPVERALGPRRRWGGEVGAVAARLASEGPVAPPSIDCCSLRPGKNFVRFRKDCRPLEWRD
jgi:hypothetical protein